MGTAVQQLSGRIGAAPAIAHCRPSVCQLATQCQAGLKRAQAAVPHGVGRSLTGASVRLVTVTYIKGGNACVPVAQLLGVCLRC